MSTVTFRGYGVQSPEITIVVEHITHWWLIDFNCNYGTEIALSTGRTVRVSAWPSEVESALKRAREQAA